MISHPDAGDEKTSLTGQRCVRTVSLGVMNVIYMIYMIYMSHVYIERQMDELTDESTEYVVK